MKNFYILFLIFGVAMFSNFSFAQYEYEEKIEYFQMEPLDDSLFIKIQEELFIDPPDPKAEIIVDLRDPNNQTVSIKGTLYPLLALTPETRAKIVTYPFKINLDESIHYGSVFSRVFKKMRIGKLVAPPSLAQISSGSHYINPFLQLFGSERLGIPIKKDIGISFGVGTPYSGPLETNYINANFHILGFYGGAYSSVDALIQMKKNNNHNNIFVTNGIQLGYVIPFGNFFEVGYLSAIEKPSKTQLEYFHSFERHHYKVKIIDDSYFNWEFRYPVSILGSTRGKVYVAEFVNEMHIGYSGRELSLAGSTFDFRVDAMFNSDVRKPQYVIDILVQQIAESWGFSAFAIGPSVIVSMNEDKEFGITSIFVNMRLKVGTSF